MRCVLKAAAYCRGFEPTESYGTLAHYAFWVVLVWLACWWGLAMVCGRLVGNCSNMQTLRTHATVRTYVHILWKGINERVRLFPSYVHYAFG